MPVMTQIDRAVTFMAIAAGLVLAGLVALTFADVILRYFFSAPLRGRQDIVEMGMVLSLVLAAPYTWRIGGHIGVDLFKALPFPRLERLRALGVKLLVATIYALIAWRAWLGAEDAALFNEATNMIFIPHRPFMLMIMAICLFHAALIIAECFVGARTMQDSGIDKIDGNP